MAEKTQGDAQAEAQAKVRNMQQQAGTNRQPREVASIAEAFGDVQERMRAARAFPFPP